MRYRSRSPSNRISRVCPSTRRLPTKDLSPNPPCPLIHEHSPNGALQRQSLLLSLAGLEQSEVASLTNRGLPESRRVMRPQHHIKEPHRPVRPLAFDKFLQSAGDQRRGRDAVPFAIPLEQDLPGLPIDSPSSNKRPVP